MNPVQAAQDDNLFKPYFGDSLASYNNWMTCIKCIYGIKPKQSEYDLIKKCTGRNPLELPKSGFRNVLLLCGRRSGKSKLSGYIAAYEALLSGREKVLSPGELGMVSVVAPTRDQTKIVRSYAKAALQGKVLQGEVITDLRDEFTLSNGVCVRSLTGSFQTVRGWSQLAVIIDELAFFTVGGEEVKVKSDVELVRSVRPSLLTTKGRLICVSTKYAPRGYCYDTWKRCFGIDNANTLVWDSDSRTMNPLLSESDIAEEIAIDPVSAKSEFENLWREDVASYLPVEVIQACVIRGRYELMPRQSIRYYGFCDTSGGRSDSAGLAIGHRVERKIVIDFLKEYKPPFSPVEVAGRMAQELKRYNLGIVIGDRYASGYTVDAFRSHGITYRASEKNRSQLYLELLPRICSKEIELPDNERLIKQLAALERRTRSGGLDVIDHPANQHDDLSNCVAGISDIANIKELIVGLW